MHGARVPLGFLLPLREPKVKKWLVLGGIGLFVIIALGACLAKAHGGTTPPKAVPTKIALRNIKGFPFASWNYVPIKRPVWCIRGGWTNAPIPDKEALRVPSCLFSTGAITYTGLWQLKGCIQYQPKEDSTAHKPGLVLDRLQLPHTGYYTVCSG